MKLSLLLTAALALAATSAFAQTTAPSQPSSAVGTATSATPKYSTTQPTPMNSTTDHMGDMNGVQTSSTMTKRQLTHHNKGMMRKDRKMKMKADGTTKATR